MRQDSSILVDAAGPRLDALAATPPSRAVLLPEVVDARILAEGESVAPDVRPTHQVVARTGPYVARCTLEVLDGLASFAKTHAIALEAVTTADFAWAESLSSSIDRDRGLCAIEVSGGAPHLRFLAVAEGRPVALRRLPQTAGLEVVSETLTQIGSRLWGPERGTATPILALGSAPFRQQIHDAARPAGLRPIESTGTIADLDYAPEAVAGAFAGTGPRFVPPAVATAAKARNRRRALSAIAAALVLLVAAAVLDTLDLRRELSAVRAARAARSPAVAELIDGRARSEELAGAVEALEARRQGHPRWTLVLSSLADGLPTSAHVTSLRAQGDSLYLELEGTDAAAAFGSVREIPWLAGFQSVAPIQREIGDAGVLTERFTASASVSWAELNPAAGR